VSPTEFIIAYSTGPAIKYITSDANTTIGYRRKVNEDNSSSLNCSHSSPSIISPIKLKNVSLTKYPNNDATKLMYAITIPPQIIHVKEKNEI